MSVGPVRSCCRGDRSGVVSDHAAAAAVASIWIKPAAVAAVFSISRTGRACGISSIYIEITAGGLIIGRLCLIMLQAGYNCRVWSIYPPGVFCPGLHPVRGRVDLSGAASCPGSCRSVRGLYALRAAVRLPGVFCPGVVDLCGPAAGPIMLPV